MDWIGGTEWIEKSEYSYIQAKKMFLSDVLSQTSLLRGCPPYNRANAQVTWFGCKPEDSLPRHFAFYASWYFKSWSKFP